VEGNFIQEGTGVLRIQVEKGLLIIGGIAFLDGTLELSFDGVDLDKLNMNVSNEIMTFSSYSGGFLSIETVEVPACWIIDVSTNLSDSFLTVVWNASEEAECGNNNPWIITVLVLVFAIGFCIAFVSLKNDTRFTPSTKKGQ